MVTDDDLELIAGFLAFILTMLILVVPMGRIAHRAGFHWAWVTILFIPLFGWVAYWLMLALRDWPWRRSAR